MAERLNVDAARLLPRYRERDRIEQKQAAVFRAEHERAVGEGRDPSSPRCLKVPTGDDRARLRGLPCIAREVSGAQPGTDPVSALLHKERQRERRPV